MSDGSTNPKIDVALTFDFDAISPWLGISTSSASLYSRGEFGPIGVERITGVLDEYDLKGTFFTPGHTAVAYPGSVESLAADGHEIGHHGWVHEALSPLSESEERSVLQRGLEELEKVTGEAPKGYRAPGWDLGVRTVGLLAEYGFSYDSSMAANDFSPYWCRSGDQPSSTEPFVFGEPVDLVEVPIAWLLDDVPFFEFVPGVGNLSGGRSTTDVLHMWKAEFSFLHDYIGEGCMVVTMHPQSTGRGHRLLLLREFIEFVLDHPNAGFVRADEIADRFRSQSEVGG